MVRANVALAPKLRRLLRNKERLIRLDILDLRSSAVLGSLHVGKMLNVAITAVSMVAAPTKPAGEMMIPDPFSPIGVTYDVPDDRTKPTLEELGMAPPPPFSNTRTK